MAQKNLPVFISHASEDRGLAQAFSAWLQGTLQVGSFVASTDIATGRDWRIEIQSALRKCKVGVVLITFNSSSREWVHYEAGAMASRGIPLIPICFWNSRKADLPSTLLSRQACEWAEEDDRKKLVDDLCEQLGVKRPRLDDRDKQKRITEPNFGIADMPRYVRYGLSGAFWVPREPDKRNRRFLTALEESDSSHPFQLIATSGGSYLKDDGAARVNGFDVHLGEPRRPMDVVLQSPFCEFALARALASNARGHHWEREYQFRDLLELDQDKRFRIRVTCLPINGSFFLTDTSAFFDPYIWGAPPGRENVERNFWVFEFRKTTADRDDAHSLLKRHFEFLSAHSEPLARYLNEAEYKKKTEEFSASLEAHRLRIRTGVAGV